MSATWNELACYVPALVQRRLEERGESPQEHSAEMFPAAVLFADVSGFTPLANRLALQGPEGAEELDRLLNLYYTPLVDLIYGHGGDVIAYAGDAAIAVWPAGENTLPAAVLRAARCGLELQSQLNQFEVEKGVRLSMKVGIGAGSLAAAFVGGRQGAWHALVLGPPLHQIRRLGNHFQVGDVLLSGEAISTTDGAAEGELLPEGAMRLRRVGGLTKLEPLPLPALSDRARAALRSFVSSTVLARLEAGQARWLSDLRPATVGFINLEGIDTGQPAAAARIHAVTRLAQQETARLGGQLVQVIEDDKGVVAIFCFGLPPLIHEDDPRRAVQTALIVQRELANLGLAAGIGISTGRVFCGPRGNQRRREYSITGSIVNLAARLMGKSEGAILCDGATYRATSGKLAFEELPPLALKGVSEPTPVYRPTGKSVAPQSLVRQLAGREAELAAFEQAFAAARPMLVEGEPGIGKSALLNAFGDKARERGFAVAWGRCDPIEQTTPYFPWRGALAEALKMEVVLDPAERRQLVAVGLRHAPELIERAALLNPLLDLDLPESELVSQMPGNARADNLHELVSRLLASAHPNATESRLVVLLDDVQWMDSASWRLAQYVALHVPSAWLILGARPVASWDSLESRQFLERCNPHKIELRALAPGALRQIVRGRMNVAEPGPRLLEYLYERSQGNPFFAEELLGYLQDCNLLSTLGERCELAPWAEGAGEAAVPGSLRALITGRVDRLLPQAQMALKTGSVIGRAFARRTLAAVYQVAQDLEQIDGLLEQVRIHKLIEIDPRPELTYLFRHLTIQQVVYEQIPRQNRRELHLAIAQWYEREFGPATAHLRLLAHHWGQAGRAEREIEYLARAGEDALENFANREAAESFQAALDRQSEQLPAGLDESQRRQRAHWERQLGEAHFHLGRLPEARFHLEQSLELLGRPAVEGRLKVGAGILWQVLRQGLHRWFTRWLTSSAVVPDEEEQAGGLHETALVFQRLSQLHYLTVEMPLGLHRALRALNLSERAGKSSLLARAYAGMCVVTGMLRFHGWAERYADLAEQTAREVGHRPTLSYTLMAAGVYRLGVGQWDRVERDAAESIALAEKLGDLHQLGHSLTLRAMLHCLRADYETALRDYDELHALAGRSENVVFLAWSHSGRGECQFRLGRVDEAIQNFQETLGLLAEMEHRTEDIRMNGLLANAHLQRGERALAWRFAQKTQQVIASGSYATVSTLEGFEGAAEVCLARLSDDPTDPQTVRAAQLACRQIGWYAKVYPMGRPRWLRQLGRLYWLGGNRLAARRCWQRALREAEKYALPFEIDLLRRTLAERESSPHL